MAWKTRFFGVAEAAAFDVRGNLTASGICPPLLQVESFPAQIAPFVLLIAEDPDTQIADAPRTFNFRVQVLSPDGDALLVIQQDVPAQPRKIQSLPVRAQLVAQAPLSIPKAGCYTFSVSFGSPESGTISETSDLNIWDQAKILSEIEHSSHG